MWTDEISPLQISVPIRSNQTLTLQVAKKISGLSRAIPRIGGLNLGIIAETGTQHNDQ